jgi:putative ABC transport system permease protein
MKLPSGVRRLLRLSEPVRDVDDELAFHFDCTVEELRASGMNASAARREAERRFGDVAWYQRQLVQLGDRHARARRRWLRAESARDVVVHAVRSVRRTPALTLAIVLTLALGLGASVTMYGIIDRLMLSPPDHVERPAELRRLMIEQYVDYRGERVVGSLLSYPDYLDAQTASTLAGAAVWTTEKLLTVGHGADARALGGVAVSGEYFRLLGVRPALGRLLHAEDARPGAERVVVISHALWRSEFGERADVLGESLDFGGDPRTIVGVAPRGLTTLQLAQVDVWLPLIPGTGAAFESRWVYAYAGVVRLAGGAGDDAAVAELTTLLRRGRADRITAGQFDANARMLVTPVLEARGPGAAPEARVARWLAGMSLIVLLIACVNVANLLLARVVRQRREFAVRCALGVSRLRLVAQILCEGALLGVAGGAAALVLAHWGGAAMSGALLPNVAWRELGWTPRLLPVALLLAVSAGVIAALVPALHAARPNLSEALHRSSGAGVSRSAVRTRTTLVLLQAALSVVLLVGAGLFVRSLEAVRNIDLGMRLDGLLYVQLRFQAATTTPEERTRVHHALLERLRSQHGVDAAAGASTGPFLAAEANNVRVPGMDTVPVVGSGYHLMIRVSDDYFRLLGIDILHGRALHAGDASSRSNVAVVNETMARTLWPTRDPIGACMYIGEVNECTIVVGVARNTKQQTIREMEAMQYFLPLTAAHTPSVVMVRMKPRVGDAAAQLRSAGVAVDPRVRFVEVAPITDRLKPQERSWRLGATLFTAFGALALVIAALGLYAVLAFDISQRTRELGIRAALGAGRRTIVTLVMGRALRLAVAGVALGVLAAGLLAPRITHLLFEVGPHDAATYGAVALTLLFVSVLAAVLPARRAAAVEPNVALRAE